MDGQRGWLTRLKQKFHGEKLLTDAELAIQAETFDALINRLQKDTSNDKDVISQIGSWLGGIKKQIQNTYNEPIMQRGWGVQTQLPVHDYVKTMCGEKVTFSMPGIDRYSVLDLNEYRSIPEPVIDAITNNPEAPWVPELLSNEDESMIFYRDKTLQQQKNSQKVIIKVTRLSTLLSPGISLFVDREVIPEYIQAYPPSSLPRSSLTGLNDGIARMGFILSSSTIEAVIKEGVKK